MWLGISRVVKAEVLTMKECGAKYQAAKTSGTLVGQSWSEFRKTQCGPDAAGTPAPATPAAAAPAALRAPGNAIFPTAVSPKYTNESAGKARMHTCLDQIQYEQGDQCQRSKVDPEGRRLLQRV